MMIIFFCCARLRNFFVQARSVGVGAAATRARMVNYAARSSLSSTADQLPHLAHAHLTYSCVENGLIITLSLQL